MVTFSSATTFAVATAFAFLIAFIRTPQPCQAASILNQDAPADLQKRLQQIRQLSEEAGLPQTNLDEEVCLTDGCLDAAFDILRAMNGSVDPCKDFYQFSCGRWIANNPIPPSSSYPSWNKVYGVQDKVNSIVHRVLNEPEDNNDAKPINQAKQSFKNCMDLEAIEKVGLEPLKQIISELGGWELLNPQEWDSSAYDWVKLVAEVKRRVLIDAVIAVYTKANIKNTLAQIIYVMRSLDQPSFLLPRAVLIAPGNFSALITAYENYIVEVAKELGSIQNDQQLRTEAKAMIEFEVKMAKLSASFEDNYNMDRIYNPFKLIDYQAETDKVDERAEFTITWKRYLDQVFSSAGINIADEEPLIVKEVEYVKQLIPILKEEDQKKTTLANYIVWRLVAGLAGETTEAMRNITFRFQRSMTGANEPPRREVTCTNGLNLVFGMAIGVKYVEAAFDKNSKTELNLMVNDTLTAFKDMAREAEWMQDVTKAKATEKADAVRSFMAYPDWLEEKEAVEKYYEGLELGSSHFHNQPKFAIYRLNKGLKVLREPTDRDEWEWRKFPGVVNAGYSPELNAITFAAGILQPPFFGCGRPKHQNYAAVGTVIGHELTHGFDNLGSQFDKDGNTQNWWDDETKRQYNNRSKCMSDQYSGFYAEAAGMYLNGELGLGENIADNGGLRESFRAYQKYEADNGPELRLPGLERYSMEQLFFLGYANLYCENITPEGLANQILTDGHAPVEFRVKGPVINSDDFARAYTCPVEKDSMNPPPEDKCIVW